MTGRRNLKTAAATALVLALLAVLLWCFLPRPMMRGELYRVTLWDGQDDVDLTDRADVEAVQEVLNGFRRNYLGRGSSYLLEEYPLTLGFNYRGGSWYLTAGPDGAFAYDSGERANWRILDGERLWQELTALLSLEN